MSLSSLEVMKIASELSVCIGSRIEKVFEWKDNILVRCEKDKEKYNIIASPEYIFLSKSQPECFENKNFSALLRKYLIKKKIISITQHKFDRVIEIKTNCNTLIIEMIKNGNIILCDKEYRIINALEKKKTSNRSIFPKEIYKFLDSIDIRNKEALETELKKSDKSIIYFLVRNGFGKFADEMLEKSGINKNKQAADMTEYEISALESCISGLLSDKSQISPELEKTIRFYAKNKADTIIKEMKNSLEKKMREESSLRSAGNILYKYYDRIKKEIEQHKTIFSLEIDGIKIKIDPSISIEKNADKFYKKAKIIKEKIKRLLTEMEKRKPEKTDYIEEQKMWYHKYYHFTTSSGFLVVAGKDSKTNEMLIKKHMEKNDVVFHAEVHGASFVVIKVPKNNEPDEKTLEETAQFSACKSKAWQMGVGAVDVYWIKPEQVDKSTPYGEYVAKGSFIIHGKKNYFKATKLRMAVMLKSNKLFIVPEITAKNIANNKYVAIEPGDMKPKEMSKIIKIRLIEIINKEETEFLKKQKDTFFMSVLPGRGMVI